MGFFDDITEGPPQQAAPNFFADIHDGPEYAQRAKPAQQAAPNFFADIHDGPEYAQPFVPAPSQPTQPTSYWDKLKGYAHTLATNPDAPLSMAVDASTLGVSWAARHLIPSDPQGFMDKAKQAAIDQSNAFNADPLYVPKIMAQVATGDYGRALPRGVLRTGQKALSVGAGGINAGLDFVDYLRGLPGLKTSPDDLSGTLLGDAILPGEATKLAHADTAIGRGLDSFYDALQYYGLGAALGAGAGPITQLARGGATFGALQGAEAYQNATDQGFTGKQRGRYAGTHAALGAMMGAIPVTKMGEGVLGLLGERLGLSEAATIALQKGGTILPEAEAFTLGGNIADRQLDQKKPYLDQSSFLQNAFNVSAMKMLGYSGAPKGVPDFVANPELARPLLMDPARIPDITQGTRPNLNGGPPELATVAPDPRAMGMLIHSAKNAGLGDKVVVNAILKQVADLSPEDHAGLLDYLERTQINGGEGKDLPIPELSPEVQKLLPLVRQIMEGQNQRYAAASQGAPVNKDFMSRVVSNPDNSRLGLGTPAGLVAGSQKSRSYKALTSPSGERVVVQDSPDLLVPEGHSLGDATTQEIEAQTPTRYSHNAVANLLKSWVDLGSAQRNRQIQYMFASHPELSAPVDTPGYQNLAPDTYDAFPDMKGRAYDPKVADLFNQLKADSITGDKSNAFTKFNDSLMQAGFVAPVHWANMVPHHVGGVGIQDILSGRYFDAMDQAKTMMDRYQNGDLDPTLKGYMNDNLKIMSDTSTPAEYQRLMGAAIGRDIPADTLIPEQRGGFVGAMNRTGTWMPSDVMNLAKIILRNQSGLSPYQSVFETGRTNPSYMTTPLESMGSLAEGNLLGKYGNPLAYTRYGVGAIKGTARHLTDMIDPTMGDPNITPELAAERQSHAWTGAASLAGLYAVKKLGDQVLKGATGDEHAEFGVRGQFGVLDAAMRLAHIDPSALSSLLHLNPAIAGLLSMGGYTRPGQKAPTNTADLAGIEGAVEPQDFWSRSLKTGKDVASAFGQGALYSYVQGDKALAGEAPPLNTFLKTFAGMKDVYSPAEQTIFGGLSSMHGNQPASYETIEGKAALQRARVMLQMGNPDAVSDMAQQGQIDPKSYMRLLQQSSMTPIQKLQQMAKTVPIEYLVNAAKVADLDEKDALDKVLVMRTRAQIKNPTTFQELMQRTQPKPTPTPIVIPDTF